MNNATEIDVRFDNQVKNLATLEKYKNTLKEIQSVLSGIDLDKTSSQVKNTSSKITDLKNASKNMKKLNDNTNNTSKSMNKLGKNINLAFSVGKIVMFGKALKNVGTKMWSLTEKSATYLENMNLLDVAYKNNTQEAKKFVNTLSEMYGLDESWGYRQIGIFKQLANAMGLSDETGSKLAKTLTQLAIDTSSLYNISVDDASQILQSGLAGQTKPVRRLGGDITMSTLQSTLDRNGIQKDISSLNYAEKRLVIVASILEQTRQAQGDWGRTIESVANQQRIFQQQTERLSRALGNMFLPVIKTILPYLNGFLMALVEIVSFIAELLGFNEEDYDFFGETDVSDLLEDINGVDKGLASAGENAKKLKQGLRGFDKLNNITTPTTGVTGVGVGGGSGKIGQDIIDLFNKNSDEYFKSLDKVEMKATKIRDKIMEWLGFTKEVDLETGKVSYKFTGMKKTLGDFSSYLSKYIVDFLEDINDRLENVDFGELARQFSDLILGIDWAGITKNLLKMLKIAINGAIDFILNLDYSNLGKTIGEVLTEVVKGLGEIFADIDWSKLISGLNKAVVDFVTGINWFDLLNNLGVSLTNILLGVVKIFTNLPIIKQILNALNIDVDKINSLDSLKKEDFGYGQDPSTITDGKGGSGGRLETELDKTIREESASYEKLNKSINDTLSSKNKLIEETKFLEKELLKLIDSNGKVKQGYEERAKFIIDKLNKYLDTEYTLTGRVIKQNGKEVKSKDALVKSIDNVIKKKREEVVVNALLAGYENAYKKQLEYESKKAKAKNELYQLELDYQKRLDEGMQLNSKEAVEFQINMEKKKSEIGSYEQAIDNSKKEVMAYGTTVDNFYKTQGETRKNYIENIGDVLGLNLQNTTEEVKTATTDTYLLTKKTFEDINKLNVNIKPKVDNKNINSLQTKLDNIFGKKWKVIVENIKLPKIMKPVLKGLGFDVNNISFLAKGGIFDGKQWGDIPQYWNSGLPPAGQIFVANERGPELVGHIGGQTFVANQKQVLGMMKRNSNNTSVNPTIIVQVGDKEVARQVISDLQDMASANGKPITIGAN